MSILYKFLSLEHAFSVLESTQLKISRLTELNDVFDCAPIVTASPDIWSENADWSKSRFEENSEKFGLLCFSQQYTSPLLWGHYSQSGAGVALAFQSEAFECYQKIEISYSDTRPNFVWPKMEFHEPDYKDRLFRASFGVKAVDWAYEREIRFVVPLDNCAMSRGLYFTQFPHQSLKQILLGFRASVDVPYLKRFLARHYPGQVISIFEAYPHRERYGIDIKPLA